MRRFHVGGVGATALLTALAACRSIFGLQDPVAIDGSIGSGSGSCTTTGLTCAGTSRALQCGMQCWVSCSDPVDHMTAKARCGAWSMFGKLAPLQSTSDTTCFDQVIATSPDRWIGLEQSAQASSVGFGWSWNGDMMSVQPQLWAPGEPDDGTGAEMHREDCATSDASDQWHDVPCTSTAAPFACRRGSGDSGGGGN